jgi:hypothetical protein
MKNKKHYKRTKVVVTHIMVVLALGLTLTTCDGGKAGYVGIQGSSCREEPINPTDSVFYDFDLFSLTPRCAVREVRPTDPLILLRRTPGHLYLRIESDSKVKYSLDIRLLDQGGIAYKTSTAPRFSRSLSKKSVYRFSRDFVARLDYYKDNPHGHNLWRLKMVQVVNPQLHVWSWHGFSPVGRDLGAFPALSEASTADVRAYLFDPQGVKVRISCLRGLCENKTCPLYFLMDRRPDLDGSVFWYWMVLHLIAVENPFAC